MTPFPNCARVLSERYGVNVETLGEFVPYAVARRSRALRITAREYDETILASPQEQIQLHRHCLVSESWYGREADSIRDAIREIRRDRATITILSAPCAYGEEPFTALELALEAGFAPHSIRIDGYDASPQAITQAQSFTLPKNAFRSDTELPRHTFDKAGRTPHALAAEYHQIFTFEVADLLSDGWRPREAKYDLILCRNLLIYLSDSAQQRLLRRLASFLRPSGKLLVAACERSLMNVLKRDRADLKSTTAGEKAVRTPNDPPVSPRAKSRGGTPRPNRTPTQQPQSNVSTAAVELANRDELNDAYSEALLYLEDHPQDEQVMFLLAVISSSCGNNAQALHWLQKVLAVAPTHEEAQLLTDILRFHDQADGDGGRR
jgi:chemotaxis protein methyltransferase WspC